MDYSFLHYIDSAAVKQACHRRIWFCHCEEGAARRGNLREPVQGTNEGPAAIGFPEIATAPPGLRNDRYDGLVCSFQGSPAQGELSRRKLAVAEGSCVCSRIPGCHCEEGAARRGNLRHFGTYFPPGKAEDFRKDTNNIPLFVQNDKKLHVF